jgi:hypothetical protein
MIGQLVFKQKHFSHIWPSSQPGTLNITTVSFPKYELLERLDAAAVSHSSAKELVIKMPSSSAILTSLGFNASNTSRPYADVCKSINEEAYAWALKTASDKARKRFEEIGQKLLFEKDDVPFLNSEFLFNVIICPTTFNFQQYLVMYNFYRIFA